MIRFVFDKSAETESCEVNVEHHRRGHDVKLAGVNIPQMGRHFSFSTTRISGEAAENLPYATVKRRERERTHAATAAEAAAAAAEAAAAEAAET